MILVIVSIVNHSSWLSHVFILHLLLLQEDWNDNLVELNDELATSNHSFKSCTSSLAKDQATTSTSTTLHCQLIPFFRERSSSDSVAMGNKSSSSSGGKASRTNNKFHQLNSRSLANGGSAPSIVPRPVSRTLVQTPEAVNNKPSETTVTDDALIGISDHSTNRNIHQFAKSTTIDSIYVDANSDTIDDVDDPSSYKDVRAHHLHSWKCDDNIQLRLSSKNPIQAGARFNNSTENLGTLCSNFDNSDCYKLLLSLQKNNLMFPLKMQMTRA